MCRAYAEADLQITVTLHEMCYMPLWRMWAHFDSLDGDEEPDAPQPRYELMHPEDSYDMPNFTGPYMERLFREMFHGPAV